MPIGFDPDATMPVWLDSDADKPEESRPTFHAKYLTARARAKVRETIDKAFDLFQKATGDDEHQIAEVACEALRIQIGGWKNLPVEFSLDAFGEVLTPFEMILLGWKALARTRFSEIDRPKHGGLVVSRPEKFASPAAPENAQTSASPAKS